MKKVIIVLVLIFGAFMSNAQTKVGHINTTELIEMMPEKDSIKIKLESIQKQWEEILAEKEQEFNTKMAALEAMAKKPDASPTIIELKQTELQQLQQSYQATQQDAQNDLQMKRQELLQPLFDKVRKAIDEVAEAKGYDYVLDSSEGSVVIFMNPENDLMELVKAKLGI